MKAVFMELPAFQRYRADYLDDDGFRRLQAALMDDLSARDRRLLKERIKLELAARNKR